MQTPRHGDGEGGGGREEEANANNGVGDEATGCVTADDTDSTGPLKLTRPATIATTRESTFELTGQ